MKTIIKVAVLICSFNILASLASAPFTEDRDANLQQACLDLDSLSAQDKDHYQFILDSTPGYNLSLEEFCAL